MPHTTEDKLKPLTEAGQVLDDAVSDQELIARIHQGDVTALDIVFQQYSAAVIRQAAVKVDVHERDDVLQEVFKEFLDQCVKGNGPTQSIGGYLRKLATAATGRVLQGRLQGVAREAKDNGGRLRPTVGGIQAILDYPDDDVTFDEVVTGDIWVALARAQLDEDELLVFEMRMQKCSWNAVAEELISQGFMSEGKDPIEAARSRFRRARKNLRIFCDRTR